jgi:anti-sigma factor RsiW
MNAMTHCPAEDVLLDYIAGLLSAARAAEFERHARECAHCEALVTSQAAVWRSLDEWKPAPVSAGFNRELWRRIDAEEAAPGWRFWRQLAPLAVGTALMVTAFWMDHRSYAPAPEPAAVAITASEADQLERALDDLQLLETVDTTAPAQSVM